MIEQNSWVWWVTTVFVGMSFANLLNRLIDYLIAKYRIAKR